MKEYIKPSINNLEVESSAIMAASSLNSSGTSGSLNNPGTSGASGGRSKRHTESLWDLSWDDEEEEEEENN